MTDNNAEFGTVQRTAEGSEGRLTRHLHHPRAAVWTVMTEEAGIAQWLAPGTIDARKSGRVHIDFTESGVVIDSTLSIFEPPKRLGYSWSSGNEPERPLLFDLAENGECTDLSLTIRLPVGEDIAKACAGFDAHLDMLAAALEGVPLKFPFEKYLAARRVYLEQLGQ